MDSSNVTDAAKLGATLSKPQNTNGGIPFVVVPNDYKVESLEKLMKTPIRLKASPTFHTIDGFTEYVKAFKTEQTRIFHSLSGVFVATMDYHSASKPGWCEHQATLTPQVPASWTLWMQFCKQPIGQRALIEFLEENAADVVDPKQAEILELAKSFHAKTDVQFASAVKTENGNISLQYVESTTATAGAKGELSVPSQIKIGLAPFEGGPKYEITALFRYRIESGKVSFAIKLLNVDKVVKEAVEEMTDTVKKVTGIVSRPGSFSKG